LESCVISLRGHHLRLLYGFIFERTERWIRIAATKEHSELQANNTITVLRKIAEAKVRVKIIDTIDAVCMTCDKKRTRMCRQFIRYDISAASDDRVTAYHYGLKIGRVYTAKHILRKLKEIGRMR